MIFSPNSMVLFFALACALCVAGLVAADWQGKPVVAGWAKTAASCLFVMTAIAGGALQTSFGSGILLALALCAAGDILLISRGKIAFLAGMASFGLGHLVLGGVFWSAASKAQGMTADHNPQAVILAAIVCMTVSGLASLRWLWRGLGPLRLPVTLYTLVIGFMTVAAAYYWAQGLSHGALVLGAAIAFTVSDLSVAKDRFVAPNRVNRAWGLPLYYSATLGFALSV